MNIDTRFVRDMADIMWHKTVFRQRSLRKTHTGNAENDGVEPLIPEKYKLVKGITSFQCYWFENCNKKNNVWLIIIVKNTLNCADISWRSI